MSLRVLSSISEVLETVSLPNRIRRCPFRVAAARAFGTARTEIERSNDEDPSVSADLFEHLRVRHGRHELEQRRVAILIQVEIAIKI